MGKTNVKSGWKRLLVAVTVAMLLAATLSIALPASAADAGSWDLGAGWTANDDGTFSYDGTGGNLRYVASDAEQSWNRYAFAMDVTVEEGTGTIWDGWGPLVAYAELEGGAIVTTAAITEQSRVYCWQRTWNSNSGHKDTQLAVNDVLMQEVGQTYTVAVEVDKAAKSAVFSFRKKDDYSVWYRYTMDLSKQAYADGEYNPETLDTVAGLATATGQKLTVSNVVVHSTDDLTYTYLGAAGKHYYAGQGEWGFVPDASGGVFYKNSSFSTEAKNSSVVEYTVDVNVLSLEWAGQGDARGLGVYFGRKGDAGFETGFMMHGGFAANVYNGGFVKDTKVLDEEAYLTTGEHTFKLVRDMKAGKATFYYDGKAVIETYLNVGIAPADTLEIGIFGHFPGAHAFSNQVFTFYNNLTVEAGAGGSVDTESGLVALGESKTITVTPDAGYLVDTVTVNGEAATLTDGALVLENILADTAVAVTFKEDVPESSEPESSEEDSSEPESSEEESSEPESSEEESSEPESSEEESSEAESSKDETSKDEASKDEASKDESSAADEEENPDTGVASALPMLAVALLSGGVALTLKHKNG